MRVLGQDSRLSTALLELFLSSPGSPSSFRLRSRVYACAATGLPRGPRASLLRAQRYHNICTRGEPGIRACITCERVTVTREPPESTLLSLLRNFSFVLAHPSRAVSIFSFFSVSLSLPSSLFRSLSTRVKLVNPLSISKRQIVSQSFLLDFNEIIRTRGSSNGSSVFLDSSTSKVWSSRKRAVPCWPAFKTSPSRVLCASCYTTARTHARTHLLFGSVSSGGAGPVSFGVFDCPTISSRAFDV